MLNVEFEIIAGKYDAKDIEELFGRPVVTINTFIPPNKIDEVFADRLSRNMIHQLKQGKAVLITPDSDACSLDQMIFSGVEDLITMTDGAYLLIALSQEEREGCLEINSAVFKTNYERKNGEELRKEFLNHIRHNATYAIEQIREHDQRSPREIAIDVAESISFGFLTYIDGVCMANTHGLKLFMTDPQLEKQEWIDITESGHELHDDLFPLYQDKDDE